MRGAFILALMAASTSVEAQPYPVKPVRIITGFGPGGSTDVVARLVAQKLGEYLRQPFVVENRPGASTALAAERVASAPPDGYTLLLLASSTTSQSALRKASLPYDLESGFVHISLLAVGPFVLVVHPSVPVKDAGELIKLARARPGRLNYGSPGVGSVNHLAALIFNQRASLKMTHIAYKGSSEATVANASGQIDLSFPSVPAALPLIEQRRVRALAVTSAKRTPVLPDVPTIAESALPGYEYVGAIGLSAPAATPRELVNRLNAAISAILNKQELREAIGKSGFEAQTSSSEQFAAFVRDDIAKIEAVVKGAGLQAD
jgi:tripartite-type tricarboxylate transporter receptor subunit TctC